MTPWFRALFVVGLVAAAAVAAVQLPETVTLDKAKNKQAPVVMSHKLHAEKIACDTCHHTQKGLTAQTATEVPTCASCHLDPAKPEVPSMREMSLTKNPLHKLCIDCHKKEAKGPTKCAECHKK
ncbi:MAG: cytochrome c family protein [Thermoanaerobaculum sp.]|nr:cytochrome c family protein [Thermoanaerobaculum sp.]MDW7967693.1 cytochrome c3 family protein [Thermoanaerobaculum sp.]